MIDRSQSLNALLGFTPAPPPYSTRLVEKCEEAFATPLGALTRGQLRLLIGQGFALEILLPLAFRLLEKNKLLATELYEGDLLCACPAVKAEFWVDHDALWHELNRMVESLQQAMRDVNEHILEFQARNPYGAAL